MEHKYIIGFVGEKLSGKGTAAKYLIDKYGAKQYLVSGILDDILNRLYLPREREKEISLAMGLCGQFGEDVLAQVLKRDIVKDEHKVIVIDGIRMPKELEILKELPNFLLVYVTASIEKRYERAKLRKEKEKENQLSFEEFRKIENGATEMSIMKIGQKADIVIFNEENENDLFAQIEEKIVNRIMQKTIARKDEKNQLIKIRRIDKFLPLPKYQTAGSVGFDLLCREECSIAPWEIKLVGTNVNIETPEGYMLAVLPRSSTPRKKGLIIPNGFGVIDQDYRGNGDEVLIQFLNIGKESVKLEKGERLAQGIFVKIDRFDWQEVDDMGNKNRGGIGSTDMKKNTNEDIKDIEDFLGSLDKEDEFYTMPMENLDF